MENFDNLLNNKHYQQIIGVIMANDSDVINAVIEAKKRQLVNFILYGPQNDIAKLLPKYYFNQIEIVNCADELTCLSFVANDIKHNKIQLIMKGLISTKQIIQMVLNKDNHLINENHLLSHVAILQLKNYHKPLFLTDGALNIEPNINQKIKIINNALELITSLEIVNPKVALISAIETVSPKIQSTVDAMNLMALSTHIWKTPCLIQGPMALDVAISRKSAKIKNIKNDVVGDADLLVMPNIESGNVLYKSFVYFGQAFSMGIVLGAKIPIILTSRADNTNSKLFSIALALWFLKYKNQINQTNKIWKII